MDVLNLRGDWITKLADAIRSNLMDEAGLTRYDGIKHCLTRRPDIVRSLLARRHFLISFDGPEGPDTFCVHHFHPSPQVSGTRLEDIESVTHTRLMGS